MTSIFFMPQISYRKFLDIIKNLLRQHGLNLLLVISIFPLLQVTFTPPINQFQQELTFTSGSWIGRRYLSLVQQIEAMNSGYYLALKPKVSLVKTNPDDIGTPLFLANLNLFKKTFSLGKMSHESIYDMQSIALFFAFAILILIGFPKLLIFALYIPTLLRNPHSADLTHTEISTLNITYWPQAVAGIITIALIYYLILSIRSKNLKSIILKTILLGTFVGWVGLCRAEAKFIALFPLLIIFGINFLSSIISLVKGFKNKIKFDPKNFILGSSEGRLTLISFVAIISMTVLTNLSSALNIKVYEYLDQTRHQPDHGSHIIWHPTYLSLSQFKYPENIMWADASGRITGQKENGFFSRYDQFYENALKKTYISILTNNLPFVTSNYLYKLKQLFYDQAVFDIGICLFVLCLILLGGFISSYRLQYAAAAYTFSAASLGVIIICLVPGVLAETGRAVGLRVCLFYLSIFGTFFYTWLFYKKDNLESPPYYYNQLKYIIGGLFFCFLFVMLVVTTRTNTIKKNRIDLQKQIAMAPLDSNSFLNYHADLLYAFNSLNEERKTFLTENAPASPDDSTEVFYKATPAQYSILKTYWSDDVFYVFLKTTETLNDDQHVIPVQIHFKNLKSKIDKDLIFLPQRLKPGTWLFSLRAPKRNIDRLTLGPLQLYQRDLYWLPL